MYCRHRPVAQWTVLQHDGPNHLELASLANGSEGVVYATPVGDQCYNVRVWMIIGLTYGLKPYVSAQRGPNKH